MGIFIFNSFVNLTADLLLPYLSKAIGNNPIVDYIVACAVDAA